jgi:hypothetical protein
MLRLELGLQLQAMLLMLAAIFEPEYIWKILPKHLYHEW